MSSGIVGTNTQLLHSSVPPVRPCLPPSAAPGDAQLRDGDRKQRTGQRGAPREEFTSCADHASKDQRGTCTGPAASGGRFRGAGGDKPVTPSCLGDGSAGNTARDAINGSALHMLERGDCAKDGTFPRE